MDKNTKKSKSDRIDFSRKVTTNLFKQVDGKCSVPRCNNPAMGPFYRSEEAVNMGVACHIYSASVNGPRGRGDKSDNFISSEKNGIWCCSYHSNLIDKKNGLDYRASDLFAWKALAEARILKQMNDIPSPLGWVESIEFLKFPVIENRPKVILSRRTLMWGKNCSGKTSLLEVAAAITRSKYAERFNSPKQIKDNCEFESLTFSSRIKYSTVDSLSKEIGIDITGEDITRYENQVACLLPPRDIEVIYCSEGDSRKVNGEDDIEFMMRALNVDKVTLFALAKIRVKPLISGEIKFQLATEYLDIDSDNLSTIYKDDGEPYNELVFKEEDQTNWISFDALSGSEKNMLILDFLIIKAREVCRQRLTLLLIENQSFALDSHNFKNLLKSLDKEDFQVVVTLPPAREKDILDIDSLKIILQPLDYLESWGLAIIGDM